MPASQYKRTKVFVERGLQLRFARFVILYVFFFASLTGLVIFLTTFMLMGEKIASVYPQGRLVPIFQSVTFWSFVSLLGVTPFIFWGSIVFSHRIAGPLPKIYRALREISDGNFDVKLVLRKRDELIGLADEINQMVLKLKERETKK